MLLESIKGYACPVQTIKERYKYQKSEYIRETLAHGHPVFIWTSHLCNWEWGTITMPQEFPDVKVYGIFKRIKSDLRDIIYAQRSKTGFIPVEMGQVLRRLHENQNEPAIYVFIADQSPFKMNGAVWLPFFNQWTPFFKGPEQLARRFSASIFTAETVRKGFASYTLTFEPLAPTSASHHPFPHTLAYAKWLEEAIRKQPSNWLWSHRRWKRKVPEHLTHKPTS